MATPQIYYKDGDSWQSAMLNSYPVGAIYSSASSISPGSIFGGGWVQITGDACLMAGNQAQYVGSKNITIANMPTHNHIGKRPRVVPSYYTGSGTIFGSALTGAWDYDDPPLYTSDTGGARLLALQLSLLYVEKNFINLDVMPNGIH